MGGEMPDPRTDLVGPTNMTAWEMEASMTALVEQFENAPPELRKCSACGRYALAFGSLWLDGIGWVPMQGCLACRRMFVEVTYDGGAVPVHEVWSGTRLHEDGQERRKVDLPELSESGGVRRCEDQT